MGLIFGLAAAAVAVIRAFNDLKERDPEAALNLVGYLRQGTSVLIALSEAVQRVLAALQLIQRAQAQGPPLRPTYLRTGTEPD